MKYIKQRKVNEEVSIKDFHIPQDVSDLNKIFNKNGHKLYIVGGAIRDFKTGDTPKDYDLCTDAIPEKVIKMLKPHYRVQLQGEAFGVVVVYTESDPHGMEIATFREDLYDGKLGVTRDPSVNFKGVTIEDDVKRRDLTINGLFFDLETEKIIDLVGGEKDINDKIIRMIGDPELRIKEDPLRILRAIRAACRY